MNTFITRITLGLVTFGLTGALLAGDAHARGAGRDGKLVDRMCQRLECSADQRTRIAKIQETQAPNLKAEREAMRALRQQVRAEWAKAAPDARTLDKLDDQIAAHQARIHDARRAAMLQIHAILTPAQRAKLAAAMDRKGKGKGEGRGERKGPRK
jgi:Spy/CpxP family protein refolding chaperone